MKVGRTALDLSKALNIHKIPDLCKILLPLVGHSRTYKVSKAREDKAGRPVLDTGEVTISPSTNAKD